MLKSKPKAINLTASKISSKNRQTILFDGFCDVNSVLIPEISSLQF